MTEDAPGAAAVGIFAILLTMHVCFKLYARFARSGGLTPEESQLVTEIKELNRSANELSTPATFAKSAKLKRQAAVKEKQLAQLRQEISLRKGWRLPFSGILPQALKVALYLLLVVRFAGTYVATVPVDLLKPLDYFLRIGRRDASGDLVAVGIIPWLFLSSRVSEFLSEKIVGKPLQKPTTGRFSFLRSS